MFRLYFMCVNQERSQTCQKYFYFDLLQVKLIFVIKTNSVLSYYNIKTFQFNTTSVIQCTIKNIQKYENINITKNDDLCKVPLFSNIYNNKYHFYN